MRYLAGCCFLWLALAGCSQNSVTEDKDLEKLISAENMTGVFGLFDNAQGDFIITDRKRFRDSAYLPASTFKVVNALIGLETGKVKDDSTVIPWDGVTRRVPEWNQDLSMYRAFRVSSVPWFQELARRIGKDTMQYWLDTLGYGRSKGRVKINRVDSFWLDNSVKMTPDEQLGLMKKLYFDQLPFQRRTGEILSRMMLMEDNSNYRLSYKTGWGNAENGDSIGWIIGWIEENKHPYFFVLQLRSADPQVDMAAARLRILKGMLKQLGFMEGKK